jgi:hypothetical protein
MGEVSVCLFATGAIVQFMGWALFFRMAIKINTVLPIDERIPLIELRLHGVSRIRRLYEDLFPESGLSATWLILMTVGTLLLAAAIIAELVRTSK